MHYKFDATIDLILDQTEKVAVCCDKVDRASRNIFDKRISTLYERALLDEIELHAAALLKKFLELNITSI